MLGTSLRRLKIIIITVVSSLVILVNVAFIHLAAIGLVASFVYLIFVSLFLSRVLLSQEKDQFFRFAFGVFLTVCFLVFVGTIVNVFYLLNVPGLTLILSAPLVFAVFVRWRTGNVEQTETKTKRRTDVSWFSPIYLVYLVLIGCALYLLLSARTGWLYGIVWVAVSPIFFIVYFLAALVLIGIIFYSQTRVVSKISLILIFSVISVSVFAIVLYPGNYGDPLDHMGFARMIVDYGSLRALPLANQLNLWTIYFLMKEKALSVLVAIFAKMFGVDVYWVHTLLTPVLWGVFVPLSAYKIARSIGEKERVSAFAAFLATFYATFVIWGSRSTGNSLGFVFFFVSLYFSVLYLKFGKSFLVLLMAMFTALVSFLVHPMTGLMALICLFLARSVNQYEISKVTKRWRARVQLLLSVLISLLIIPALFYLNDLVYIVLLPERAAEEAGTAFSLTTLLQTDPWSFIFEEFVNYSFKDVVLFGILPLLGIIGFAYALKKRKNPSNVKVTIQFLGLAFGVSLVEYRLVQYAMINPLFGPGRILAFRDLIAVPFAALTISLVLQFLEGYRSRRTKSMFVFQSWKLKASGRYVLAWILIGLSVSAYASSSLYRSYDWLGGLQPTALEVAAVKFIDNFAQERYVVITNPDTALVGEGFVGIWNVRKWYEATRDLHPSATSMFSLMRNHQSAEGYYVLTSWTVNFEILFEEASHTFGLKKVLSDENSKIYIFEYKIAPLPPNYPDSDPNTDVMAFYWDTPVGYYIQNGLMRVVFNNVSYTLDVVDFYGDVYETIDLNKTLVDGESLGRFLGIEYLTPNNNTWVVWYADVSLPFKDFPSLAQSFSFRLRFEKASMIAVLERGKPFAKLKWEGVHSSTLSLDTGDFDYLYVPGLMGGVYSYDVNSREFGFLYLLSRTSGVVLSPASGTKTYSSSLTYTEISKSCNLNITEGYLTFDVLARNNATEGKWAIFELWLPDEVYLGAFPPMLYSLDGGKTWSGSLVYTNFPEGIPVKTLNDVDANWIFTRPSRLNEAPQPWWYFTKALGGTPTLPTNFTYSGGAQNRLFYGLYLPAGDEVNLRLGFSVYGARPLKTTYQFLNSDNPFYGLNNMKASFLRLFHPGTSELVGGLNLTEMPPSLSVTEDENGKIKSIIIGIESNNEFVLFAMKGVNTATDANNDGIPDSFQG